MTFSLSAAALHVSKDTPKNGWRTKPGAGYEHRREVRRNNGRLFHDGPHVATPENDGNTVPGRRGDLYGGGGDRLQQLHPEHRAAVAALSLTGGVLP